MASLPWLVQYGAAVWQVCLALLVLGAIAVAWRRPRVSARRAARLARAGLAPAVELASASRGARVTLSGTIDRSGDRPLLRSGSDVVVLEGDTNVLVGSREDWPRGEATSRGLSTGDRVLVSGVLGDEAGEEARTYRAAARNATLGGGLVMAFEGAPRVRGPASPVLVRHAAGGALLFLAIFGVGGEIAMAQATRDVVAYEVLPAASMPLALELAAATPFRRDGAIELLTQALDVRDEADPVLLGARGALHEMRHERAALATMWIAHGQPGRGAKLAEQVEQHALAARGFYADGQFDRASDAWERVDYTRASEEELRFGVGVHLLAGQLERAARAAGRLAERWSNPPATASDAQRAWYEDRARGARCLASAIDLADRHETAPIPWARHRVTDAIATMYGPCALLYADRLTGEDRISALNVMRYMWESDTSPFIAVPAAWFELLGAEVAPKQFAPKTLPFESAADALALPSRALAAALPGVERGLAEALLERRTSVRDWYSERPHLALVERYATASAAVFAALSGEAAQAKRFAVASDEASAILARLRAFDVRPRELPIALDALAATSLPGDPEPARLAVGWPPPAEPKTVHDAGGFLHGMLDFVAERDAGPMVGALVETPPPNEDEKVAWWIAAGGDGNGLAQWLARPTSRPGTFLRYGAPFVGKGRTAVINWILWGRHPSAGFHPIETLIELATLAEAARKLRTSDGPTDFSAVAARFRAAILRRDTAVPLAVLERL
jgi:hypothetical protein